MWTYLIILFSFLAVVAIFARRAILLSRTEQKKNEKHEGKTTEKKAAAKAAVVSRKDKSVAENFFQKGETMIKAGKEDDAIKAFVQALALDESHQDTQKRLAMLYMQKQMFAAASALFRQLAETTKDPLHYSHLGLSLYQQSEFEEAKGAYQAAITLDPSRSQRFVSLAQVYRSLGEIQNAIIALTKAVEMEPENPDYLIMLGDVHAAADNSGKAREALLKAESLDPENETIKEMLKNLGNA